MTFRVVTGAPWDGVTPLGKPPGTEHANPGMPRPGEAVWARGRVETGEAAGAASAGASLRMTETATEALALPGTRPGIVGGTPASELLPRVPAALTGGSTRSQSESRIVEMPRAR